MKAMVAKKVEVKIMSDLFQPKKDRLDTMLEKTSVLVSVIVGIVSLAISIFAIL